MEINITALDYFRELELMEKQYGQEYGLYFLLDKLFWYTMKGLNLENNRNVCIRFIGSATNTEGGCSEGRKMLKGFVAFPDFIFIDEKFDIYKPEINRLYGCVEAKKPHTRLKNFANTSKDEPECSMNINIKKEKFIVLNSSECKSKYRYYSILGDKESKENCGNLCDREWILSNTGNVNSPNKPEKIIERQKDSIDSILREKDDYLIRIEYNDATQQCFKLLNSENKVDDFGELLGELFWYGKVIYTNGLHWQQLRVLKIRKVDNNEEIKHDKFKDDFLKYAKNPKENKWYEKIQGYIFTIHIEEISNLTVDFNKYYKGETISLDLKIDDNSLKNSFNKKTKKYEILEVDSEWIKLIKGLANINWYEESKSDICCLQPNEVI